MKTRNRLALLFIIMCLGNTAVPVYASEDSEVKMDHLMTVAQDVEVKELPSESSDAIMDFEAGEVVYVVGEALGGWCQISYQGSVGYVKKESLKNIDVDFSALEKEMQAAETEGKIVAEEVERVREEEDRSVVWIVVLAVVLGGILVTGVLIAGVSSKRRRRARMRREREF